MKKFSRFLVLALAVSCFIFAFSQRGIGSYFSERYLSFPMLQPGEKIDDMVITTGIEEAFPLWAVCAPKKVNDYSISADCGELSYENLAIGHTLGVMDLFDASIKWEDLKWDLSVDGFPIDLEAFGVYDFVHPDFPSKPLGEVFMAIRVWDVVLVNPTPGIHRLQGQAQTRDGIAKYIWVVKFTVPGSTIEVNSLAKPSLSYLYRYTLHSKNCAQFFQIC